MYAIDRLLEQCDMWYVARRSKLMRNRQQRRHRHRDFHSHLNVTSTLLLANHMCSFDLTFTIIEANVNTHWCHQSSMRLDHDLPANMFDRPEECSHSAMQAAKVR